MFQRILQGDPRHRTRLHDFEGNLIPVAGVLDLLPCLWTTVMRKSGRQLQLPWWPYAAIRKLGAMIRPSWRVLEFGSGASTPWLATRAATLLSLESDPVWFERVGTRLGSQGLSGVDLRLHERRSDYVTAGAYCGEPFDLVIVDGAWRDECAHTALRLVRPGGYVYFDNSDVPDPDHRSAVNTLLLRAVSSTRFTGLGPGTVSATQGLLVGVAGGGAVGREPAACP